MIDIPSGMHVLTADVTKNIIAQNCSWMAEP